MSEVEDFRHNAEVREVLRRFPAPEQITAYLEGVEKMRGKEAKNKLRLDLLKEWKKK